MKSGSWYFLGDRLLSEHIKVVESMYTLLSCFYLLLEVAESNALHALIYVDQNKRKERSRAKVDSVYSTTLTCWYLPLRSVYGLGMVFFFLLNS